MKTKRTHKKSSKEKEVDPRPLHNRTLKPDASELIKERIGDEEPENPADDVPLNSKKKSND